MTDQSSSPELLDELPSFPDARGGRTPARAVQIEVRRSLTGQDLEALLSGEAPAGVPQVHQPLTAIRHAHHQLARHVAHGTKQEEISLITGYSPSYISILKTDPAFAELVAYYATQENEIQIDVLERMKALGLSATDELQRRLADEPEGWAKRELMELVELTMGKNAFQQGGGSNGPQVAVNVSFVTPESPKIVEGEVKRSD